MTKEEAIKAMQGGKKVRHVYFLSEEYIYMQNGKIYDENGYPYDDFWNGRSGEDWENNWEVSTNS